LRRIILQSCPPDTEIPQTKTCAAVEPANKQAAEKLATFAIPNGGVCPRDLLSREIKEKADSSSEPRVRNDNRVFFRSL
jgi:hypothetical protein